MKLVVWLCVAIVGGIFLRASLAPPSPPAIRTDADVQLIGAALEEKRAQSAHERARARCTSEPDELMRSAAKYIDAKDPAAAVKMLSPCLDGPDTPKKLKALHSRAEKAVAAQKKSEAIAEAKLRKSRGVRIGMTPEEAIASSWGKPQKINRTTTRRGTREQWVYGGGNYLYFEDDILVSYQN